MNKAIEDKMRLESIAGMVRAGLPLDNAAARFLLDAFEHAEQQSDDTRPLTEEKGKAYSSNPQDPDNHGAYWILPDGTGKWYWEWREPGQSDPEDSSLEHDSRSLALFDAALDWEENGMSGVTSSFVKRLRAAAKRAQIAEQKAIRAESLLHST